MKRSISCVAILLAGAAASAVTVTEVLETNPASVTATMQKSCQVVYDNLDKQFDRLLSRAPYVQKVSKINETAWKETGRTNEAITSEHKSFYLVSTSMSGEFPLSLFSVATTKTACIPNVKDSTCVNAFVVTVEGTKALVYQKAVELRSRKSIWSSFKHTLNLDAESANTCTLKSALAATDSNYLWSKRHLIGSVDPVQVEKRLFKGFVSWTKSSLATLEE